MMIMMIMDHDDPGAGSVKPQLSRLQKIGVTYQEFALRWSLWLVVIIIITKLMIRYRYCVIIKLIIRDEEDEDIFEKLRPAADWIENALQVMIIMIISIVIMIMIMRIIITIIICQCCERHNDQGGGQVLVNCYAGTSRWGRVKTQKM